MSSINTKALEELKDSKVKLLIELGLISHYQMRTSCIGSFTDEMRSISEQLRIIDSKLYEASGASIPDKSSGKCPHCGSSSEGKFCSSCGSDIETFYSKGVEQCSVCNHNVSAGGQYCIACGSKFNR